MIITPRMAILFLEKRAVHRRCFLHILTQLIGYSMDKRGIAFVALFSLCMLGVNGGFHWWNQKQRHDYLKQKQEYELYLENRAKAQRLSAIIPIETLSLIENIEGGWGLRLSDQIVLLNSKLTAQTFEGKKLLSLNQQPITCAIYGSFSDSQWLQAVKSFTAPSNEPMQVTLLSRIDGIFYPFAACVNSQLMLSDVTADSSTPELKSKLENGLILITIDGRAYPVATFSKVDNSLQACAFAQYSAIASSLDKVPTLSVDTNEKFYLLENDYLQLVISSKGAAIAEINLPFDTTSPASVIKEVELDKKLLEQSPANALFPLQPATIATSDGNLVPAVQRKGGFYPLIRRALAGDNGQLKVIEPKNYALSLVNEFAEVSNLIYRVVEFSPSKITLETAQPHRRIRRSYELPQEASKSPYCFETQIHIEGDKRDLWISSGVPEAEVGSASPLPILKYRISTGHGVDVKNFDNPSQATHIKNIHPDWVCNGNAFFGVLIDPIRNQFPGVKIEPVSADDVPSKLLAIDAQVQKYKASTLAGFRTLLPLPASESTTKLRILAGPMAESVLKTLDNTYSNTQDSYDPHYRSTLSFNGWFSTVLRPFSNFMMMLMNLFHALTHSWALAILLLTVVLRLMLYPLNAWSNASMKKMQELSPKIKAIQEKHQNDPKRVQMEMVMLYKQHKVNPVSGCLPIVIQIPFLFSMLHLFKTNFSLRGASFIPGWIDDLASPDVIFSWGYSLPVIGSDFHLLPILLGAAMFAQSLITSSNTSQMTETQRQQKAMSNVMTLAFTFMFYNLPSGLNLYWLASSVLGMAQQWWQQRGASKPFAKKV